MVWKDRLFWALFLCGLLFYGLMFFLGMWTAVIGSALWILAFTYLVLRSFERWTGGLGGRRRYDNGGET